MKDSSELIALVAEVEVAKVRFDKGIDLGIEFTNQIDAWTRMQYKFSGNRFPVKYARRDLVPFVYSMRERID